MHPSFSCKHTVKGQEAMLQTMEDPFQLKEHIISHESAAALGQAA